MKKLPLVFCLPLFFAVAIHAQEAKKAHAGKSEDSSSAPIFSYIETMPTATVNISQYLSENIVYPVDARKANIEGRVIARFVIEMDGAVTNATIVHGIGGGCDEEALRVVSKMPRWKPGRNNGKPVRVYFTLPIVFKLED